MKSKTLACITAMTLFAVLAIPLRLAGQEQPAAQTNPLPFINQPLVPDAVSPGGKGFMLTVNGAGFVSGSVVNWNGSALATTFVSDSRLTATVPASDIAKASTASITVVCPGPGGGTSNVIFFGVHVPIPIALGRMDYATGGNPHSVITSDLNGDGKLDLVTADRADNTISVLLGNGDGTFQARTLYTTAAGPLELAAADLNGDGKLDLAVADQYSNSVSILLGNGGGTFQGHVEYATGNEPISLTLGDFNKDGKLDLAVTNGSDNTVSILLGNGDGTFQPQASYATGMRPFPSITGDFNGDGILDLAVGNQNGNSVSILLGKGDGTFQPQVSYAAGSQVYSLITADFDGDGHLDLAIANFADNTISVLLGNGDGTLQSQANYPTALGPHTLVASDFNGDGKLDLGIANENGNSASILLGNGDGTFRPHVDYSAGAGAISPSAGDFNQDGRLDLAVTNFDGASVSIMLQDGTITLLPPNVNFGVQVVGTKSTAQKVKLTNIGTSTVTISSIAITGIDRGDFSEKNNCGSSLPPKAHCTINVTFKPTKLGPRAAAVTIADDAPGSPQSVPLSGIGVTSGPHATLSTKHLNYATQLVGTTSPAQPVKLSNYGTETLSITSIVASGDFSTNDNCGSSLPPGGSCTIDVSFAPMRGGHRTGTLTITDNAPDSPQKVSLKGTGTVVKLDPSRLDFGTVRVGQKSSSQNTTLTNTGKTRLHITNIAITGTDSGDFFIQQDTCPNPGYLGAGKSCTITATFGPTQSGSRSADVSVSDDGGGSPQQVSLSGTGENQCSGQCGLACLAHHCRCSNNRCVAASNVVVEETASRQTCGQTNPFTELR